MTARIRKLPPELVDRIAAGEVVERPASVVKELIENALDAGAREIAVEVRGGGVESIAVRDDGSGMSPEDLALAFASHATSKLASLDDLERIASFGFRGEALASVGAVADCRIVSRERGAADGHEVDCRGGDVSVVRAAASPEGTLVEVRGLFRHVPARRKFLRSTGAESAHVTAAVERAALARPDVAFALVRDGRRVLRVTSSEGRGVRIPRFFGEDLFGALLPVAAEDGRLRAEGFVARPEASRPTAAFQHLFLDGRPIRDRGVAFAVRRAFEGLLTKGLQPVWFLFLSMDPSDVDVNVHPAKSEVRFRDPERVNRLVHGAVRAALLRADLAPSIALRTDAPAAPRSAAADERIAAVGDALAQFLVSPANAPSEPRTWSAPTRDVRTAAPAAPVQAATPPRPVGRYLQVRDTYLVFETDDGLAVVDQHALHERIRLEEIHERLHAGGLEVQRLLVPRVVELPQADAELLLAAAEDLRRLGVEVGAFGPTTVAVHALPALFGQRDPAPFLRDVVERLREDRAAGRGEAAVETILHSMACRSAVMAGDPLTESQVAELLRRADLIDTRQGCAHGRPTALRIPLHDLERHFRR